MRTAKLFYSDKCPDTATFVDALQGYQLDYESVNITASMPNLKGFLSHRDQAAAFEAVKAQGNVGVPVLHVRDSSDHYLFTLEELGDFFESD